MRIPEWDSVQTFDTALGGQLRLRDRPEGGVNSVASLANPIASSCGKKLLIALKTSSFSSISRTNGFFHGVAFIWRSCDRQREIAELLNQLELLDLEVAFAIRGDQEVLEVDFRNEATRFG